ncbi:MAG: PilN domain-containing protein [Planctomycetota bacterium]|jgi:hypothetical protein
MKQRPIDLLPDSVRARSQAGVVAGRYVVALLSAVAVLVVTGTHSRLALDRARERMQIAEEQADLALAAEAEAARLRRELDDTSEFIRRYELMALPLEISRVIATITNDLPSSASIDRFDFYAGTPKSRRSVRSRGVNNDEPQPRVLTGELSGFAATDRDVAEIVTKLEALGLAQQVSLDFSRTRAVRGRGAREFRISFRVDLDVEYDVVDRGPPSLQSG